MFVLLLACGVAEPAEDMKQALKRYSDANYNFDLMRQIGVPMKTVQLSCKGLDIVVAGGTCQRHLHEFLPSGRDQAPGIPLDELPVYLHVSEMQCSTARPIYPDQLRVDGPEPYRSLVSLPDSCFSVVMGEVCAARPSLHHTVVSYECCGF